MWCIWPLRSTPCDALDVPQMPEREPAPNCNVERRRDSPRGALIPERRRHERRADGRVDVEHMMSKAPRENVVITGGTAGIGRATAREFARNGCNVAVLARGEDG